MADAIVAALPNSHFLQTAESAGDKDPDRVCDQVADALVDVILSEDQQAKVSLEVSLKGDLLVVLGSVCTTAQVAYEQVARRVIKKTGYDGSGKNLGPESIRVVVHIEQLAAEIAIKAAEDGATGDEGSVLGYATNETNEAVPLGQLLAARFTARLAEVARACRWASSESKVQVTMEYKRTRGKIVPTRVHTVLVTVGPEADISSEDCKAQLREQVVKAVVPEQYLDDRTVCILTAANRTSGRAGRHSLAAGKDPGKVDRCGALAARWIAKSLVKGGFCDRAQLHIAYGIGVAAPLAVHLDSFGTAKGGKEDKDLLALVLRNFDLLPDSIVRDLSLRRAIYERFSERGACFTPEDSDFPWEAPRDLPHD